MDEENLAKLRRGERVIGVIFPLVYLLIATLIAYWILPDGIDVKPLSQFTLVDALRVLVAIIVELFGLAMAISDFIASMEYANSLRN